MNKLGFLFLILVLTLASCDGRDRVYKTNKVVLKEHNLLSSFSEQAKFTPEEHIEIQTDTLLDNKFNIKIKYFSSNKNQLIKTHKNKENTLIKHHYKNFEAVIKVTKGNHIISNRIINKQLFSEYETKEFWNDAIMQFVWVDYNKTTSSSISLNVSFCAPEKNTCRDYSITILENGNMKIENSNFAKNII